MGGKIVRNLSSNAFSHAHINATESLEKKILITNISLSKISNRFLLHLAIGILSLFLVLCRRIQKIPYKFCRLRRHFGPTQ